MENSIGLKKVKIYLPKRITNPILEVHKVVFINFQHITKVKVNISGSETVPNNFFLIDFLTPFIELEISVEGWDGRYQ